ncbi:type VI secretion system Vgr family protein [Kangiella shandongensis]|uniref:type VI secretion system Vgr family protein n=1 Tax=Kangiella shandongensis TaxID=2763258 RepID=UPI001CBC6A4E|nr:type VI secretion system tip protein TssI/VgrG [Kangiella shandongensis]
MGLLERYTQGNRLLQIHSPLGDNTLLMTDIHGQDSLSNPFEFTLTCLSEEPGLPAQDLVGQSIDFGYELNHGGVRYFNGYVARLSNLGRASESLYRYRLIIVPKIWFLGQRVNLRIFQEQSLLDIVQQVLGEHEVAFKNQTVGSYSPHPYCVQYKESDLAFIHRLLEEAGIYYYFIHEQGKHTLVLADNKSSYPTCPQAIVSQSYGSLNEEYISEWQSDVVFPRGVYSARGFNFESPDDPLEVSNQGKSGFPGCETYEVYDYPGEYYDSGLGEQEIKARMEEQEQFHQQVTAHSTCRELMVGGTFNLKIHEDPTEIGKGFLITAMTYEASDDSYLNNDEPKQEISNQFTCIPKTVQYRPERRQPKPSIQGLQSAIVTGPAGEEIYTDEYGRVKVQFHWDREGQKDENSSCWVRVSHQWAGTGFGGMNIPRIGQEVLVEFEDGDPDRPIITGRVYNANSMPPYSLPNNKTQSGWMSRSTPGGGADNYNGIRFEDKKGQEQYSVQAEKNMDTLVKNDESRDVLNNRTKTIGNDETVHVKHDRTETVDNNETITIGNNRKETVGKNETIDIGADRTESVGGNESITVAKEQSIEIGKSRTENVGKNETITVGMNKAETITLAKALSIGAAYQITVGAAKNESVGLSSSEQVGLMKDVRVGKKVTIVAGDEIQFATGEASITLKKNGEIVISGNKININGDKNVTLTGKVVDVNP